KENAKDIVEIAPQILKGVQLVQADNVDEGLRHALVLDNPDEFFKRRPARNALDVLREADNDEPDTPDGDEPGGASNLSAPGSARGRSADKQDGDVEPTDPAAPSGDVQTRGGGSRIIQTHD